MSLKINKVVIASDSFKECLTSLQVAAGVEEGIRMCLPDCKIEKIAVADGGEGTVDSIIEVMGGQRVSVEVEGPSARPVRAEYALVEDGHTAVMEMSSACGLALIPEVERNPMKTSTYGLGQMISDALDRGCRRFIIGLGGSATNDGGTGMLAALGWRFLDSDGNQLSPVGESLGRICGIDASGVRADVLDSRFEVACDVDSPFYGIAGAAYVYGPQKGADPIMVQILDDGLRNFADVVKDYLGKDVGSFPGAGAAGGTGGAFKAFLDADLRSGAELMLDLVGFDSLISDADLIVTGEGRIDGQTAKGKLPYAVAGRASAQGVPVLAICGQSDVESLPFFMKICRITPAGMPLDEAMLQENATLNIINAIRNYIDISRA